MFYDEFFGSPYGYGDDGLNRHNWSDKSEAAIRRERTADGLFDTFLQKCSALDSTNISLFPVTEEIIKANTYLTGPCYTSFRKRVMGKGCKVKRRDATPEEKRASGDKRKGKLYVISITCPVHPSKAAEAKTKAKEFAAAKKAKAKAATERKAEKEKIEREERDRLAALQRARVREKYATIVGAADEVNKHDKQETPTKTSSSNLDTFLSVDVTPIELLVHAQRLHEERELGINCAIKTKRNERMEELRKKHAEEEQQELCVIAKERTRLLGVASSEYDKIKTKIDEACKKGTTANMVTPEKVKYPLSRPTPPLL